MDTAMSRIEAALARIERLADQKSGGDSDLAERHDRLRTRVSAALVELDTVIESLEA